MSDRLNMSYKQTREGICFQMKGEESDLCVIHAPLNKDTQNL